MPPLVHVLDGHVSPGLCMGLLPPGGGLRALGVLPVTVCLGELADRTVQVLTPPSQNEQGK